jgi:dCTP deaminase
MAVLADSQIREEIRIEPFEENVKRPGRISYGVSSYGYDVRVGSHFKIFTPTPRTGGIAVWTPRTSRMTFSSRSTATSSRRITW